MRIPGEIMKSGSSYSTVIEAIGAYGQGRSRKAACQSLVDAVNEVAADHHLSGLRPQIDDDGEATVYLTAADPRKLVALVLRCQRTAREMSLADVAKETGARSRNNYAQYELGDRDPSIGTLQAMLDAVAPEYTVAIVPRTARIIPRWDEDADDIAEIQALLHAPSPANAAALRARGSRGRKAP